MSAERPVDPNNPVVRLCAQGMEAEGRGDPGAAAALFRAAWDAASTAYEACVAAHYLARHQPGPAETLHWNQVALDRAVASGDDRVRGFHASLHLNLGQSFETMGDRTRAAAEFRAAEASLGDVPDGPYRALVERGVRAALARAEALPE